MEDNDTVLGQRPSEIITKISNAFPVWFEKLNLVVGLTALGFAVYAFKSEHPEIYGWFFILAILVVMFALRHYFPKDLKSLRKKKDKSLLESVVLKGIESHFLSMRKSLVEAPVYWIGLGSLFSVANGFKAVFVSKVLPFLGG